MVEKARLKAEDEPSRLAVERVSLLLELRTSKNEVSAHQVQALKEKKALEEAYEEGFDVIFNYGYGCCAFTHNIYGSQPVVLDGIPDMSKPLFLEFFINPRCSLGVVPAEAATVDVCSGEAMIAPEKQVPDVVLETDISEAGKHFSAVEVGLDNEPDSSA